VIVILSLLAGVVVFEPWLIILLVVSIIPTILHEIKFSGTSYSLARSWTQERRELDYLRYAGASDVTAKEVKLFGLSNYIAERFKVLSDKYYLKSKKLAKQRATWGSFFNVIGTGAYYGAYVLIVFRTVAGIFTLGDLTFLSGSFNRLRSKLQGFFTRFTAITESALYLQDYFEFLDLKYEENPSEGKLPPPEKITKGFEFKNVGFKYPKSERWVVRNINFELKAGEKLAFVGENGAGKTTLIKLLLRFYEPTEGEILLDGIPVKQYNKTKYQQYFGVIFQDFVKFELTLRENIAMGEIGEIGNQPRIANAAEKSLADQVVSELPKGYDQQLGKRFKQGKDLSGGQWQKIAIARAYMKDAEVLILDEPTSSLDARAETEAFKRFIQLTEGKTAVIISHRFSTVRIADRIMVLKDGAVLEIGTHEELMKNNKLYAELFNLQAAGYQ
jgi:ATP-binding cassette subfamily B protein